MLLVMCIMSRDNQSSTWRGRQGGRVAVMARLGMGVLRARAPQTLVEKIVQQFALGEGQAACGDQVMIRPRHVLTHDNTMAVIGKFEVLKTNRGVKDEKQPVFALDHDVQNRNPENLRRAQTIEEFARKNGIAFYPAGRGVGHQVMIEEGYAWPGTLVVAADSHATTYGGMGCLGTPVVRSDAAVIWATGRSWWRVPPVVRVTLHNRLPHGSSGKDLALALCAALKGGEARNHALEFAGEGVETLAVDERLTVANMAAEALAVAAVFPPDETVLRWLAGLLEEPASGSSDRLSQGRLAHLRRDMSTGRLRADPGAEYAVEVEVDLASIPPMVAGPGTPRIATPAHVLAGRKVAINRAYLCSCTNARASDLRMAAAALRGRAVAEGVKLFLAPASSTVMMEAMGSGDMQVLEEAGARVLPAGCGPCIGLGEGLLEEKEVGISTSNRNFPGRMGSRSAECYLASPETVALSAALGYIVGPPCEVTSEPTISVRPGERRDAPRTDPEPLVPGFPPTISGRLVLCPHDAINTDAMYAARHTYRELSGKSQAAVAMEGYDSSFAGKVEQGDVVIGGRDFGTGSSREQAATALRHAGVSLILAESVSATFERNALNNGLACVSAPGLVPALLKALGLGAPTAGSGAIFSSAEVVVDFEACVVRCGGVEHPVIPLRRVAQELVAAGGLEGWARNFQ